MHPDIVSINGDQYEQKVWCKTPITNAWFLPHLFHGLFHRTNVEVDLTSGFYPIESLLSLSDLFRIFNERDNIYNR